MQYGHDQCHTCQKRTDGLQTCTTEAGDVSQLCPDCLANSNFCHGCGQELTGEPLWDMPDYCPTCKMEMLETWADEAESGLANDYSEEAR